MQGSAVRLVQPVARIEREELDLGSLGEIRGFIHNKAPSADASLQSHEGYANIREVTQQAVGGPADDRFVFATRSRLPAAQRPAVTVLGRRCPVNVMKRKVALRKIIARRILVNRDSRRRVIVSIGLPTYIGDGWDWVCPFKISGLGHPIHDQVHGIDALQALQLVSLGIRKTLENKRCPLAWLGDPFWQSGFPTLLSGLGDPELVRRLETLVQKEITRWVASKRRRIMSRKRQSNVRLERTAPANRRTTR